MADRVFLDSNVLFSAAYSPNSRLLTLWSLHGTQLVTSLLAVEEAKRNLAVQRPESLSELDRLVASANVITGIGTDALPDGVDLSDKDVHILTAAIESRCTHLLTGDVRHFGHLLGQTIAGVLVQTPAQFIRERMA